ncbi:SDR family NAD(P)-dependent oxidoreductase [Nocardia sp. CA-128927]|uniref:SDR family NAD(P)-dependent oxidoreductase n=1 Tax=Nocardia sp. CA-128927 TaxID=3239975 RepID=UPI003D988669
MDLAGKTALVTGGTRGIGLAIAQRLLVAGANVMITGRNRKTGISALKELDAGEPSDFYNGDACRRDEAELAVQETVSRFGGLDIVVNNVGGADGAAFVAQMSDELWHETLAINLDPTLYTTRKALEYLMPQGSGRIINISSIEGRLGDPGLSAYAAAKHAVIGFTRSLAREVGPLGITANCVCPGITSTDWIMEKGPGAAAVIGTDLQGLIQYFIARTALGRITHREEVAAVVHMLASDAGSGITGANIPVDGGSTIM